MAFKYRTLAAKLQADISSGSIPEKLPAEDDLAQQYHVSRQTVRKALDLLADQGLIEKHKGTASRVLRPKDRSGDLIAVVTSYIDDYIFPAVLSGIQNVLISAGYSTVLYATENRYAEERKIKVHQHGEKEGKPLTDYEAGLRSGYLQCQSDHAGMYKYKKALSEGKSKSEAKKISRTKGKKN